MNVVAIVIPICTKAWGFYLRALKNTLIGNKGKAVTIRDKRHG